MKNMEGLYKNERDMYRKECDERKNKQQTLVDRRKLDQKIKENEGLKDYKKHLKELKQGYAEPRVPRRAVEGTKPKAPDAGDLVDKKKDGKASPDRTLDTQSEIHEGRIVKREVKASTDPTVIAMNHQEAVDQLNVVTDKVTKGAKIHKEHLTKIQEEKFIKNVEDTSII